MRTAEEETLLVIRDTEVARLNISVAGEASKKKKQVVEPAVNRSGYGIHEMMWRSLVERWNQLFI